MAKTVYEVVDIELSDGTEITVRPLTIKNLKKFNEVIKGLQAEGLDDNKALEVFIDAGLVCMKQFRPELAEDKEAFEDVIEVPTLMRILEIAGGLRLTDPNFGATDLVGTI